MPHSVYEAQSGAFSAFLNNPFEVSIPLVG